MGAIDDRLAELGIELPAAFAAPPGVTFRFERVHVHAGLAHVSGHGPMDGDRPLVQGALGGELGAEEGAAAARQVGLSVLASLREELGSLDIVDSWVRAIGFVRSEPGSGFAQLPAVVNGFSELILDVWGAERGAHARSAIGVAALPFDWPVEVEAVVAVRGE